MRNKILNIASRIRLAVLSGKGLTIYYPDSDSMRQVVTLVSKGEVIAGATLAKLDIDNTNWYEIMTLWSAENKEAAAVTLLFKIFEYYKHIIPDSTISPAALKVVARFYKKYKGTEVVVENISSNPNPALAAGYVWSPSRFKSINVEVGKATPAETKELEQSVVRGFDAIYSDPKRTKADNPNDFYTKGEMLQLYELLQGWMSEGGAKENQALMWIADNHSSLMSDNDKYSRALIELYEGQGDY